MNLVKWFRKNNKKVMAVVVIVLMFVFVGGSALERFLEGGRSELGKKVAYFADARKVTNNDLIRAHRELEILQMLEADVMLRSIWERMLRLPDLRALLLGELLFSDRRSPALIGYVRRMIATNRYRISNKQINDIYRASMTGNVYWLLLEKEAELAGIKMSNEYAGRYLAGTIPQLPGGETYKTRIDKIVNPPQGSNRRGIPEDQILTTFGKLLAVLEYARQTCSSEDVTSRQIMHTISWEGETIDVEFVRFDSSVFAEGQKEPTEEEISAHLEKYKKYFAGTVSEENPYGFGYKLADRVQLEYIAVKLDDVSKIVAKPTQEEAREYYMRNRRQFIASVLSDPNDPNSPLTEQVRSYGEVASSISTLLSVNSKNSRAQQILQDAKMLTEAGFEDTDTEPADLSVEDLRRMAGDYGTAAEELSKRYEIKVYAGQTGLLGAADMLADEQLGSLYIKGRGENPVGLVQAVFAIDELGASELGPFDVSKPRMYQNIGPARDMMEQIMVIARVVKAEKASEPESVNQTFSKKTLDLKQAEEQASDEDPNQSKQKDVYSVKEKVVEDLKKLAAMDTTKSKAEEFADLAAKDGWESAVEKFNTLYGKAEANDSDANVSGPGEEVNEPQEGPDSGEADKTGSEPFELQDLKNLRRVSSMRLGTLTAHNIGNPVGQISVEMLKKEGKLLERLYSLIPQDSNTVETVPLVLEFKPDMSCYCLKKVCVERVDRDEYIRMKVMQAYREEFVQSQSLAAVHFNPENISNRMRFRWAKEEEQADANAPAESEERW